MTASAVAPGVLRWSRAAPPARRETGAVRRILTVSSGHRYSTVDVFFGLQAGFAAAGVESHGYEMMHRFTESRAWLEFIRQTRDAPDFKVEDPDIAYQANKGAIIRALELNADAVVIVCGLMFHPKAVRLLARAGIPVFWYGTESPYEDGLHQLVASDCTVISLNDRQSVPIIEKYVRKCEADTRVMYLPIGYDPAVHYPGAGADDDVQAHDVVFVGTTYPSRVAYLEAADWSDVDLGLYGHMRFIDDDSPLWQYIHGAKPGDPLALIENRVATALHTRAKICVNFFRSEQFRDHMQTVKEVGQGESLSPRVIELAAAGNFFISEYRPELEEVFGDLVPVFSTPAELEALVRRYLDDDEARARIEAELPERVAGYSYHDRAREIIEALAV